MSLRTGITLGLLLGLLGACGPKPIGTLARQLGQTPTGKAVSIYADPTFVMSDAVSIEEETLTRAMKSSSYFVDEDINALGPVVAKALKQIEPDQRVAVISEGADQPVFHFFARNGEIHIVRYRGGRENARHATVIPSASVAIEKRPPVVVVPTRPADPVVARPTDGARPGEDHGSARTTSENSGVVAKKENSSHPAKKKKEPKKPDQAEPTTTKKEPRLTEPQVRAKLKRLGELREKKLITEDEYQTKRKELLNNL